MIVVIYNFFWITNSTGNEIKDLTLSLQGSSGSIASGILNVFTYTSSLYHLLYMGLQRLKAISQPLDYKLQSNKTVYYGLTGIWILSALSATLPSKYNSLQNFTLRRLLEWRGEGRSAPKCVRIFFRRYFEKRKSKKLENQKVSKLKASWLLL